MKIKLDHNGFRSTNYFIAKEEQWDEFNYILASSLKEDGTHLSHYDGWAIYAREAKVIFAWCEKNIKSEWAYAGGKFYFKLQQDYVMFALKWA